MSVDGDVRFGEWDADGWFDVADVGDVAVQLPAELAARDAVWCPDVDSGGVVAGELAGSPFGEVDDVRRALSVLVDGDEFLMVVPDEGGSYTVTYDSGRGRWAPVVSQMPPGRELAGVLDSAAAAGTAGLSEFELGEIAAGCQRLMSWARGVQAAAVTELSERPVMAPKPSGAAYASVSARTCAALELTEPLRLTTAQAETLVAESVQLVEDFPATHAALTAGEIDERRARVIVAELGRQDQDVARIVETAALVEAAGMNTRQLRRRIKTLVHQLAPVAAEERRRQAAEARHARISPAEDGMAWLEALLPAEDAMALKTVLEAGQKTLKRHDAQAGGARARTADQRRVDVLARLAWNALSPGRLGAPTTTPDTTGKTTDTTNNTTYEPGETSEAPTSNAAGEPAGSSSAAGPPCGCSRRSDGGRSPFGQPAGVELSSAHGRPVSVHVTVPLSTLIGLDDHPGELAGYGPIPADVARHLSTAGVWQWVGTHDVTGAALRHGRSRYVPTRDLADHVILRDRTCRAPGCAATSERCDLDHTIAFGEGGTDAGNLGLFCRHHHLLKHHSRWQVEQPESGVFVWTSPTGRTTTITTRTDDNPDRRPRRRRTNDRPDPYTEPSRDRPRPGPDTDPDDIPPF